MSSIIVIKMFTKEFSWWSIVAVLPLGLSPYFLECLSYKFDSPYMSLSVFASLFPLLFVDVDKKLYGLVIFCGALVMLTTYQASSGIFVTSLVFLMALRWNRGYSAKYCFKKIAYSMLIYAIAGFLFKFFLVKEVNFENYAGTSLVHGNSMLNVIFQNIRIYLSLLWYDATDTWKALFVAIALFFIRGFVYESKRNKLFAVCIAVILVIVCSILSYGAYLLLQEPLFSPRALYGFGVFLALMGIVVIDIVPEKILNKAVCLALSWSLFVFALAYGNALAEQKRYDDFRLQLVLSDLSKIPNMDEKHIRKIRLQGEAGFSPVVQREALRYKVLNRLMHEGLYSGHWLGEIYLYYYYNLSGIEYVNSWSRTTLYEKDMPVFVDSSYHTIKADDRCIIVKLKNIHGYELNKKNYMYIW